MRSVWLLLVLICLQSKSFAQPQNSTWYFGHYAGLKFDSAGNITVLNDSAMSTRENSTCLSDTSGNLVMYSDGAKVFNQYNQQILHGDSLYSRWLNYSWGYFGVNSLGGSILLPSFNNGECVLFTCNTYTSSFNGNFLPGLVMNTISVDGDSIVLPKNQMIYLAPNDSNYLSEQILAIKHANGRDWWLLTHKLYSDAFWLWLYDPWGVHGPYEQHMVNIITARLL